MPGLNKKDKFQRFLQKQKVSVSLSRKETFLPSSFCLVLFFLEFEVGNVIANHYQLKLLCHCMSNLQSRYLSCALRPQLHPVRLYCISQIHHVPLCCFVAMAFPIVFGWNFYIQSYMLLSWCTSVHPSQYLDGVRLETSLRSSRFSAGPVLIAHIIVISAISVDIPLHLPGGGDLSIKCYWNSTQHQDNMHPFLSLINHYLDTAILVCDSWCKFS